ncbi:MAG: hypothetical protein V2A67_10650 [Bacteroidota bacterium]
MNKTLLLLLATLLTWPGYGQIRNYTDHGRISILTGKTSLEITAVETKLTPDIQAAGLLAAAGTILPPVVDLVVSGIEQEIKKNALAFQGTYAASASGDKFYRNNDFAALPRLLLTRTVKLKDEKEQTVVEIELIPELSADLTAFRYYVKDKFRYEYSLAKTRGRYSYIYINLEIKFRSIYISKETYKVSDLRTTAILVPMVHVGETEHLPDKVYSGWIPLPPRSNVKTNNETEGSKVTYERLADNTGLYEIEISITETNPFKIRAEKRQEIIKSTREPAGDILKAIIKTVTEEE